MRPTIVFILGHNMATLISWFSSRLIKFTISTDMENSAHMCRLDKYFSLAKENFYQQKKNHVHNHALPHKCVSYSLAKHTNMHICHPVRLWRSLSLSWLASLFLRHTICFSSNMPHPHPYDSFIRINVTPKSSTIFTLLTTIQRSIFN